MGPGLEIEPLPETGGDYVRERRQFAQRYYVALFFLYGCPPAWLGLFLLSRFWFQEPATALVLMVVWMVATMGSVWWAGEFRCPRCCRRYGALGHGQHFKVTRILFDKTCSNCKLLKFQK